MLCFKQKPSIFVTKNDMHFLKCRKESIVKIYQSLEKYLTVL